MGTRSVETILEEWRVAERELAEAPAERWLGIMARIDQLNEEYDQAVRDRETLADDLRRELV
jgi:hypothetical protein